MDIDYVIVKKSYVIKGSGLLIEPEASLSEEYVGRKYKVIIENTNTEKTKEIARVTAILLNASKGIEIFTFVFKNEALNIDPGTKIKILTRVE